MIIEEIIKIAVSESISFFKDFALKEIENQPEYENNLRRGFEVQIDKAKNFSETLALFRTSELKDTESSTIELSIKTQSRHFSDSSSGKQISESDLLYDSKNHIILGDPGSGKTTTLKRLIKKLFDILFSEKSDEITFSFPIIINLGEIKKTDTLMTYLCKALGIKYDRIEHVIEYEEEVEISGQRPKKKGELVEYEFVTRTRIEYEYKIGHFSVENAIGNYLNEMNIIIFLDGLDEVHHDLKDRVYGEIKTISQIASKSKIILSSRYLEEIKTFKYFNKNEILPLEKEQAKEIANYLIDNTELFFDRIKYLPYKDLIDRPLFLYLLLILFHNNNDNLPEQAADVYRRIVLLVIKEWDEDREYQTTRYSKYKDFDAYKKEDFLSELAFYLTYELGVKKSFTYEQLRQAYNKIYNRYPQLTADDALGVIGDIETHNGLIMKLFDNQFEYSHLSLQEYLCAKYLLSVPFSKNHYHYFNIASEPLAVAVVLSPKPDEWFSMLILNNIDEIRIQRKLDSDKVYTFIRRLFLEQVVFPKSSEELGFATLYLLSTFRNNRELALELRKFLRMNSVSVSISKAIEFYRVKTKNKQVLELTLNQDMDTSLYISVPKSIEITRTVYKTFKWTHTR